MAHLTNRLRFLPVLLACLSLSLARGGSTASTKKLPSRFFSASDKTSVDRTNGQQFVRELPPRKPNKLAQATPRYSARRSETHALGGRAGAGFSGGIKVISADGSGTQLGYVSTQQNDQGNYGLATSTDLAMVVSGTEDDSGADLAIGNGVAPVYPFLGGIQGQYSDSTSLALGSSNYLFVTGTAHTDPQTAAADVGNSYSAATNIHRPSESSIWLYDSSTGQLFVEWTNADNSTASGVDLVWFEASGNFAMTADVSKYESTYGNAQQVNFFIDPSVH